MKSWKTPTPDQIDKAVALLGHAEQYRYFFDRLENPEWIEPLKKKGFFSSPPNPDRDDVRGTIGFSVWPESRYLVRMAELKPAVVLEIILKVPNTENVRVYEDFTDAALKMPAVLASRLLEKAKTWARSKYQLRISDKLGELIVHFAKGNQTDAALELAQVLLEITPEPKGKFAYGEKEGHSYPTEASIRFALWDYSEILKKDIPVLLSATKVRGLDLLCDLLDNAIKLSIREDDGHASQDYSYIWRRTVEDDDPNLSRGIKDILVTAIRNAAEQLIKINAATTAELVSILEARRWKVFHRLVLHLLKVFGSAALDIVASRLTNQALFDDYTIRHEYGLLLREHFNALQPAQQKTILSWIEQDRTLRNLRRVGLNIPGSNLQKKTSSGIRKSGSWIGLSGFMNNCQQTGSKSIPT